MALIRKFIYLLILNFLITNTFFSQLRIVKDNIACAYGLKNEKGEWFLKPEYILIEDLGSGYYRTLNESGKGICTSNGCPLKNVFDDIIIKNNYIEVWKNKKIGLYSLKGDLIVPIEFNHLVFDGSTRIMCYKSIQKTSLSYTTTCYNLAGQIQIPETSGYILPFGGLNYAYIGDLPLGYNEVSGHVGMINEKGEIIIPRNYDKLKVCDKNIIFYKDNKIGKINFENDVLLEAKHYITPIGLYYNPNMPCLDKHENWQFIENGKTGIISYTGEIIHPPTIDWIKSAEITDNSSKIAFFFSINKKMGMMASDGSILVNAIYDTLITRPRLNWNNNYTVSNRSNFIYKLNGKYGLLSHEGKVLTEALYDNFLRTDYAKIPNYLFTKGLEVYYLDFNSDSIVSQKTNLISSQDSLYIFEFKGELFSILATKKGSKTKQFILNEYLENHTLGNFFVVNRQNRSSVFTLDGKAWWKDKVLYLNLQNGHYALIYTKLNKQGLMDLKTGKIIMDTLYDEINQSQVLNNIIWAKIQTGKEKIYYTDTQNQAIGIWTINEPKQKYYESPVYKWMVFDKNGDKISKNSFDQIVWYADTTMATYNHLQGIVDAKLNWLIPPKYKSISHITKDYFSVYTISGKFGIVDLQNRFIVDTSFTEFEIIYKGIYSDWKRDFSSVSEDQKMIWFLLKKETSSVLMNNLGDSYESKDAADRLTMKKIMMDLAFDGARNSSQTAFRIMMTEAQHQSLYPSLSTQKQDEFKINLYEYTKKIYQDHIHADSLQQNYGKNKNSLNIHAHRTFTLLSLRGNFISIDMSYPNVYQDFGEMIGPSMIKREVTNFIYPEGNLIPLSIDSIFGKGEVLQNELIIAIQARDDLKLDCSSLEKLTENFRQSFNISEKGITLYYSPNEYYYNPVEVLIPIERLKLHAESEWLVKYLN